MAEKTPEQIRARKMAMAEALAKSESEDGGDESTSTVIAPVKTSTTQQLPYPYSTTSSMVKPIEAIETNEPPNSLLEDAVGLATHTMNIPTIVAGSIVGQIPGLGKYLGNEEGKSFIEALEDPNTHIFKKVKELVDKSDMNGLNKFAANFGLDFTGDPTSLAGITSLVKGGLKGLTAEPSKLGAEVIAGGVNKISAKPINERALTTLASKGGEGKLKGAFEQLPETANALNNVVYKPSEFMAQHEAVIQPILAEVKDINPKSVIDVLKKNLIKKNVLLPEEKSFNASLKQHIDALEGNYSVPLEKIDPHTFASKKIDDTRLPLSGNKYRDMRIELDQEPSWEGVVSNNLKQRWNKTFQEARTVAKNELIKSTPDKYRKEMVKYADKYDAISRMKLIISKNPDIADLKAPGSIINIGKVNLKDVEVRNALKNLDAQFGLKGKDSFYEKAKLAADANAVSKPGLENFELSTTSKVSTLALKTINAIKTVSKAGLKIGAVGANPLYKTISGLSPEKQEQARKAADDFNKAKTREQKQKAQAEFDSVFTQTEE